MSDNNKKYILVLFLGILWMYSCKHIYTSPSTIHSYRFPRNQQYYLEITVEEKIDPNIKYYDLTTGFNEMIINSDSMNKFLIRKPDGDMSFIAMQLGINGGLVSYRFGDSIFQHWCREKIDADTFRERVKQKQHILDSIYVSYNFNHEKRTYTIKICKAKTDGYIFDAGGWSQTLFYAKNNVMIVCNIYDIEKLSEEETRGWQDILEFIIRNE